MFNKYFFNFNTMKNIILALLVMTIMVGCSNSNENAENNIALIEKYIQAVEDLDFTAMETVLSDDYVGLGPSINDSIGKRDAVDNWKQNVENLYESISYNRSRVLAITITSGDNQDDWISNWAELNIVYKADKKSVTIWANTVYQIENNKIVKSYTFYNEADVLEQLGYVFINPNDL